MNLTFCNYHYTYSISSDESALVSLSFKVWTSGWVSISSRVIRFLGCISKTLLKKSLSYYYYFRFFIYSGMLESSKPFEHLSWIYFSMLMPRYLECFTFKRVISEKQFIEDDSYRPEISLKTVWKVWHDFRCHIENSPTSCFGCVLNHLGESKVTNLAGVGVIFVAEEEYVLWLEIAMHNITTVNGLGSVQYLWEYLTGFAEIECFFVNFSLVIM